MTKCKCCVELVHFQAEHASAVRWIFSNMAEKKEGYRCRESKRYIFLSKLSVDGSNALTSMI